MKIEPGELSKSQAYKLLISALIPRPIALAHLQKQVQPSPLYLAR